MESKQEEDQTLWEKVKQVLSKHYRLVIIIIILLLLINIQNPQSVLTSIDQKGGDAITESIKKSGARQNVGKFFSGLAAGQGAAGNKLKSLKNTNVMTSVMGWMFGFIKSLMMFAGMIIALAVLPGLPIFIFMLILFFILRARMSFIKEL